MVSALSRKSITDLSRRRSRTFFSVVTLALAVASIGLFALPTLMNRAMHAAVTSDRLPDLTIYTRPLRLDAAQLAALAHCRTSARSSRARSSAAGCTWATAVPSCRCAACRIFSRQRVDVVHVASGTAPRTGEVLTDVQNANQGLLRVRAGASRADHRRRREPCAGCGSAARGATSTAASP